MILLDSTIALSLMAGIRPAKKISVKCDNCQAGKRLYIAISSLVIANATMVSQHADG
jgi:hypothetical protein